MRYFIDEVEIYPEYHPKPVATTAPADAGCEISPEFMARYETALKEWRSVQDALGEMLEEIERKAEPTR